MSVKNIYDEKNTIYIIGAALLAAGCTKQNEELHTSGGELRLTAGIATRAAGGALTLNSGFSVSQYKLQRKNDC